MTPRYTGLKTILRSVLAGAITTIGIASFAPAQAADIDYAIKSGGNDATRAATKLLKKGEAQDAANIYINVVAKGGRAALVKLANTNLCAAQSILGNFDAAIAACDAAIALDNGYWEALVNRGHAHLLAGNKTAALADFRAAQQAQPGEALIDRAIALADIASASGGAQ